MPVQDDLKIEKQEGKEYPPLPKDVYQVQLIDVEQQEKPTYDTRNKSEEEQQLETVLNFQYALLEGKDKDQDLRGRRVWANFVPTYLYISSKNGKNKLYRIVEALLGRELTLEEEAKGITGKMLNELIGRQCRVSVEPKTKGEKTYDNITDWLKSNNDLEPLTEEETKTEESEEAEEVSVDDIPF